MDELATIYFRGLGKFISLYPQSADFPNDDGSDNFKETIEANYKSIKQEILALVASETKRIMETPESRGLVTK